jgi:hypothetical protein
LAKLILVNVWFRLCVNLEIGEVLLTDRATAQNSGSPEKGPLVRLAPSASLSLKFLQYGAGGGLP